MVHKPRPALLALVLAAAALGVCRPWSGSAPVRAGAQCRQSAHASEAEHGREKARGQSPVAAMYSGPAGVESSCRDRPGHPESFADLARANGAIAARSIAPGTQLKAGAFRAAIGQRAALPQTGGTWSPYGNTPLIGDRTEYDTTNGSTGE